MVNKRIELPVSVLSSSDAMFARVTEYLRDIGELSDDDMLMTITMEVTDEEPIVVTEFETYYNKPERWP